jgi:AcrR family transcriptional regulator
MGKGDETRAAILDQAVELASLVGLGGLTIGSLAAATRLSKSGLYAHFESKESLQVEVLRHAREHFVDVVMRPTLATRRGEARVRAFFEHWLRWQAEVYDGGCVFVDAASEFDDQPGPVRDELVRAERDKLESVVLMVRGAVSEGELSPDLDAAQFAFELEGILLAHHHARRLMRDDSAEDRARQAFERLLASAGLAWPVGPPVQRP